MRRAAGTCSPSPRAAAAGCWFWRALQPRPLTAIAAALVIAAALGGSVHLRHEHRRTEATREFDESIRITEQTMEHTREQLRRAGVALDGETSLGPQ